MKNVDKIIRLREFVAQLPTAPDGAKLVTAKACEELCGIPVGTIHSAAHYGEATPRMTLGSICLWGVEDLIELFQRPQGRRSKRKTNLNPGRIS